MLIVTSSAGPGTVSVDQLLALVQVTPSPPPVQARLESTRRSSSGSIPRGRFRLEVRRLVERRHKRTFRQFRVDFIASLQIVAQNGLEDPEHGIAGKSVLHNHS